MLLAMHMLWPTDRYRQHPQLFLGVLACGNAKYLHADGPWVMLGDWLNHHSSVSRTDIRKGTQEVASQHTAVCPGGHQCSWGCVVTQPRLPVGRTTRHRTSEKSAQQTSSTPSTPASTELLPWRCVHVQDCGCWISVQPPCTPQGHDSRKQRGRM